MREKKQILLVLRAQTGDMQALNRLLESVQSSLYWYICNTLTNKSYAKDILQEVFIIVYKKISRLKHPEYFRTWLYRITSREIFRFIKKNPALSELCTESEFFENIVDDSVEPEFDDSVLERIFDVIKYISPASRAVITLHYKNNLLLSEIADVLEIPPGTVKSRLSYGLKVLREKLDSADELREAYGEE